MKLFPSDWPGFLNALGAWGGLSIAARRTFLDGIAPGLSLTPEARRDPALEELQDEGMVSGSITERYTLFHQVMKSLQKWPLFESPGLAALCSYLAEHYTAQERSQIHESLALLPNDLPRIAGLVSSVEWVQTCLYRRERTADSADAGTARALLAFFTEQRDRISIRDLEEYFPGIPRDDLCRGVRHGLQRAIFFLCLRRSDLEPLIGIWPTAARRLRRLSVVLAPEPIVVTHAFCHPFLVEDMTTLIAAALVEPIPLRRGDDRPFSRFVEEATPMLLTLPEWLERITGLSLEGRVELALRALRLTGLLLPADAGAAAPLVPAARSRQWIREPLSRRQAEVVGAVAPGPNGASRLFALLEEEWGAVDAARDDILPWLVQAFASVPMSTHIRFADFAEHQAAIGSPLAVSEALAGAAVPGVPEGSAGGWPATEEAVEELWKSFLGIFFGRCIISMGGAEAGIGEDGRPGFRITEAGRRLLGLPGEGREEATEERGPPARLIVSPNFEIVFLSPNPGMEAALGRCSERLGRGVGVLFRITRASLRKGAAAGFTSEELLEMLARESRSPVPSNVAHEVRGWMGEGERD